MSLPIPAWLEEALKQYRRKLNNVRLRAVYSNLIKTVGDKQAIAQPMIDRIKEKVKTILDKEGILSDFHPSYYAYSYALDKSQRTLPFMVDRIREHTILRNTWENRGLDPAILDKLDSVLIFALS